MTKISKIIGLTALIALAFGMTAIGNAVADEAEKEAIMRNSAEIWRSGQSTKMTDITVDSKWKFVVDYAPLVWLAKNEKYFPSSIEYLLENTEPKIINNEIWAVTQKPLGKPSSRLKFFRGFEPSKNIVPVYAFVLPEKDQAALEAIEHPEKSRVRVVYFTFYPYNRGKEVANTMWGNHVTDIEKCYITFFEKVPISITCSVHSWEQTLDWNKVERSAAIQSFILHGVAMGCILHPDGMFITQY